MARQWQITRDTKIGPGPGPIAKGLSFPVDPIPGDILDLDCPAENMKGYFKVLRRLIDSENATLEVTPHTD